MADPDDVLRREIAAEQVHADRAYALIHRQIDAAEAGLASVKAEKVEAAARYDRDVRADQFLRRVVELGPRRDAPVMFGRIDLDGGRALHIGRAGVLDDEPLVIDWRTPAAMPFYRATHVAPGDVVRRRHIAMDRTRVAFLDDEALADRAVASSDTAVATTLVGEAALLRALRSRRSDRMGEIVATIQGEQDEIIRRPAPANIIVQGGPGTGKTAVALHRVAFQLFAMEVGYRPNVLVVGPTPGFLRYVGAVLPALGEHGARLTTAAALALGQEPSLVDRPDVAALKADARMVDVIASAVRMLQRVGVDDLRVPYGSRFLTVRRSRLRELRDEARSRAGSHNHGAKVFRELVLRRLVREVKKSGLTWDYDPARTIRQIDEFRFGVHRLWPALEPSELLRLVFRSESLLARAAAGVLDAAGVAAMVASTEPVLLPEPDTHGANADPTNGTTAASVAPDHSGRETPRWPEVGWSRGDAALLDEAAALLGPISGIDPTDDDAAEAARARRRVAKRLPGEDMVMRQVLSEEAMADVEYGIDDDMRTALIQRLREAAATDLGLVEGDGDGAERLFGIAVVDEAQDLSPMEWRVVRRRTTGTALTIVGDLSQAGYPWSASSWEQAAKWAGLAPEAVERLDLTIGYRSPSAVMDLARRIVEVGGLPEPAPNGVRDVPDAVRLAPVASRDAVPPAVATACAEAPSTVAVAAPASLVAAIARSLPSTITVGTASAVKGLEFDRVVVVEPAAIVDEHSWGDLYVALTRTQHHLIVIHADPLPW